MENGFRTFRLFVRQGKNEVKHAEYEKLEDLKNEHKRNRRRLSRMA